MKKPFEEPHILDREYTPRKIQVENFKVLSSLQELTAQEPELFKIEELEKYSRNPNPNIGKTYNFKVISGEPPLIGSNIVFVEYMKKAEVSYQFFKDWDTIAKFDYYKKIIIANLDKFSKAREQVLKREPHHIISELTIENLSWAKIIWSLTIIDIYNKWQEPDAKIKKDVQMLINVSLISGEPNWKKYMILTQQTKPTDLAQYSEMPADWITRITGKRMNEFNWQGSFDYVLEGSYY